MRTRTNTNIGTLSKTEYDSSTTYNERYWDGSLAFIGNWDPGTRSCYDQPIYEHYIVDDPNKGNRVKRCQHLRWDHTPASVPSLFLGHSGQSTERYFDMVSPALCADQFNRTVSEVQYESTTGSYPNWIEQDIPYSSSSDGAVLSSLMSQARDSVIDGMLNIAEADETVKMFLSLAKFGRRLLSKRDRWEYARRTARRILSAKSWGNLKGLSLSRRVKNVFQSRNARAAASAYLAYDFGLKPLIDDAFALVEWMPYLEKEMANYENRRPERIIRTTLNRDLAITLPTWEDISVKMEGIDHQVVRYPTAVARYGVLYAPYFSHYASPWSRKARFWMNKLGAKGPATLLYDLVPFSFIANWFVDMDALLRPLDDLAQGKSISWLGAWKSLDLSECEVHSAYRLKGQNGEELHSFNTGVTKCSYYERVPLDLSIASGLRLRFNFGWKQSASSAALIRQRLR